MINRLVATGKLNDPKYHPIHVVRIAHGSGPDLQYEARSLAGVSG